MGYIFIFLSVLANAAKGYCSKKISDTVTAVNDVININIIRNVACCIISAVIVLFNRRTNIFSMRPFEIVICLISGISMTLFLLNRIFAIKTDTYTLVDACASASSIFPCIVCGTTATPLKMQSKTTLVG